MSEQTRKYINLSRLYFWLSILCTISPVIVYLIRAFVIGTPTQKLSLGCFATVAVILVAINVMFKMHIRSTIWILILGIYLVLHNILPLLLMIACSTILDEFILTPLHKKYKSKACINKEIDKRLK